MTHQHIFSEYVRTTRTDKIVARCDCGAKHSFPRLAKNRVTVAHSAHGAGGVLVPGVDATKRLDGENGD